MRQYQTELLEDLKTKRYVRVAHDNEDESDPNFVGEEEDSEVALKIDSTRIIEESDLERIRSAQTNEEFLDCYHHFHLHYGCDLIAMKQFERRVLKMREKRARKLAARGTKKVINEDGEEIEVPNDDMDENDEEDFNDNEDDMDDEEGSTFVKYASRKDRYHHCKAAGLTSLANKFGLTCEQFGENLTSDYQMYDVDQCAIEPSSLAADFVREPNFQNVDQVLAAAKYMVVIELAKDPVVRSAVREMYMQNVCINVRPVIPRGRRFFRSFFRARLNSR